MIPHLKWNVKCVKRRVHFRKYDIIYFHCCICRSFPCYSTPLSPFLFTLLFLTRILSFPPPWNNQIIIFQISLEIFTRKVDHSENEHAPFNRPISPRNNGTILEYSHEEPKQTFTSARYSRPRYRRISVKETRTYIASRYLSSPALIPPARDNGRRSKHVID